MTAKKTPTGHSPGKQWCALPGCKERVITTRKLSQAAAEWSLVCRKHADKLDAKRAAAPKTA